MVVQLGGWCSWVGGGVWWWASFFRDTNEILQNKKSSITMFVIFQAGVVVLMMNLIIAIMGDSVRFIGVCVQCFVLAHGAHVVMWIRVWPGCRSTRWSKKTKQSRPDTSAPRSS